MTNHKDKMTNKTMPVIVEEYLVNEISKKKQITGSRQNKLVDYFMKLNEYKHSKNNMK